MPTDVLDHPSGQAARHCPTPSQHSPLLGGITITNLKPDATGTSSGQGTLGCFATIDGVSGPEERRAAVEQPRARPANGAAVGTRSISRSCIGGLIDAANLGPIAKIHNLGVEGPHNFTYPVTETEVDYHLDCATREAQHRHLQLVRLQLRGLLQERAA